MSSEFVFDQQYTVANLEENEFMGDDYTLDGAKEAVFELNRDPLNYGTWTYFKTVLATA